MPADCNRKTNGPALPSMIGISGPATSTCKLSIPSPASADIKCSTVEIDAPSFLSVDDSRVSPTLSARRDRHRLRQIDAMENNAGVGRRRAQVKIDARARVQTDAGRLDRVF